MTAICAVLDSAGDPTAGLPMVVDIAAFTGAVLLLVLVATAVARRVCGGQGASAGATASRAALLYSTIDLPWEASGLVMGDDDNRPDPRRRTQIKPPTDDHASTRAQEEYHRRHRVSAP